MRKLTRFFLSLGLLGGFLSAHANSSDSTVNSSVPTREQAIGNIILGEMAINQNQLDNAHHYYAAATSLSKNPTAAKKALYIALMAGQESMAVSAAQQWAQLAPMDLEAQLINVDLSLKTNQMSAATKYIQQAIKINPGQALSKIIEELESAPISIQQALLQNLQQLPQRQKNKSPNLAIISLLSFQTGQSQEALKIIDFALGQTPAWPQLIALKVDYLVNSQQIDQALSFAAAKAKAYPKVPLIQMIDVGVMVKANQNDAARLKLQALSQDSAMRGIAFLALAQLSIKEQNMTQATAYLKKAAADPSQADSAHYLLAEIYEFQKKPELAIQNYQAIKNGPYHVNARLKTAKLMASLGQNDAALETLSNIQISNNDEGKQIILLQVELLMNMQEDATAMALLNKANTAIPNDITLLYARSMVANAMQNEEQTEKDLKQILAIDPTQVTALNALAYLLTHNPARHQEALRYSQQALALAPNDPAILDTMGWLQYNMGNYSAASRYLAKAYKGNQDGLIAAHYGEVLWRLGNRKAAQNVWQTGLEKSPNDPDLQKTVAQFMGSTN